MRCMWLPLAAPGTRAAGNPRARHPRTPLAMAPGHALAGSSQPTAITGRPIWSEHAGATTRLAAPCARRSRDHGASPKAAEKSQIHEI
jgi:hypothetical protein